MGQDTKIQWAHHTFNPWRGCTKVAAGCANCYADTQSKRNPGTLGIWGPNGTRVVSAEKNWRDVLKWNRTPLLECQACGTQIEGESIDDGNFKDHSWVFDCPQCDGNEYRVVRPRVFCASMADVFEDWDGPMMHHRVDSHGSQLPLAINNLTGGFSQWHPKGNALTDEKATMYDVRQRLFDLIDETPNLDWLLVTKRPENVLDMWPRDFLGGTGPIPMENVWLLTSVATQADADQNIPELLKCRDLCPVLGVSAEPLLGPIELEDYLPRFDFRPTYPSWQAAFGGDGKPTKLRDGIDWVIAGGESGPGARPCNPDWLRSTVSQCQEGAVPVFVKQLGARVLVDPGPVPREVIQSTWSFLGESDCGADVWRTADPKGGNPDEWPEDLRVRQFPEVV